MIRLDKTQPIDTNESLCITTQIGVASARIISVCVGGGVDRNRNKVAYPPKYQVYNKIDKRLCCRLAYALQSISNQTVRLQYNGCSATGLFTAQTNNGKDCNADNLYFDGQRKVTHAACLYIQNYFCGSGAPPPARPVQGKCHIALSTRSLSHVTE